MNLKKNHFKIEIGCLRACIVYIMLGMSFGCFFLKNVFSKTGKAVPYDPYQNFVIGDIFYHTSDDPRNRKDLSKVIQWNHRSKISKTGRETVLYSDFWSMMKKYPKWISKKHTAEDLKICFTAFFLSKVLEYESEKLLFWKHVIPERVDLVYQRFLNSARVQKKIKRKWIPELSIPYLLQYDQKKIKKIKIWLDTTFESYQSIYQWIRSQVKNRGIVLKVRWWERPLAEVPFGFYQKLETYQLNSKGVKRLHPLWPTQNFIFKKLPPNVQGFKNLLSSKLNEYYHFRKRQTALEFLLRKVPGYLGNEPFLSPRAFQRLYRKYIKQFYTFPEDFYEVSLFQMVLSFSKVNPKKRKDKISQFYQALMHLLINDQKSFLRKEKKILLKMKIQNALEKKQTLLHLRVKWFLRFQKKLFSFMKRQSISYQSVLQKKFLLTSELSNKTLSFEKKFLKRTVLTSVFVPWEVFVDRNWRLHFWIGSGIKKYLRKKRPFREIEVQKQLKAILLSKNRKKTIRKLVHKLFRENFFTWTQEQIHFPIYGKDVVLRFKKNTQKSSQESTSDFYAFFLKHESSVLQKAFLFPLN